MEYSPVDTSTVNVSYRLHNQDSEWNILEYSFINDYGLLDWGCGKIFSANLSQLTLCDSIAYDLKVEFEDLVGNSTEVKLEPAIIVGNYNTTSIQGDSAIHSQIKTSNYPNPFNPSTTIDYILPKDSDVNISIFNIKGQKVRTLVKNSFQKGKHSIVWNGKNDAGKSVSSGVYFYKLNVNDVSNHVRKCILMK